MMTPYIVYFGRMPCDYAASLSTFALFIYSFILSYIIPVIVQRSHICKPEIIILSSSNRSTVGSQGDYIGVYKLNPCQFMNAACFCIKPDAEGIISKPNYITLLKGTN